MRELEVLLKAVSDGLKAMGEGIQAIAKKVDDIAKAQAPKKLAKSKKPTKRKAKPAPQKGTRKAKLNETKPLPATEKVLKVIKKFNDGVDNATIIQETGLDRKQVANALSQLKKTGKVTSVKRGVHMAA